MRGRWRGALGREPWAVGTALLLACGTLVAASVPLLHPGRHASWVLTLPAAARAVVLLATPDAGPIPALT